MKIRRAVLASCALLAFAAPAAAQQPYAPNPGPSYASRGALEERWQRLEQAVRAGSRRFQAEADLIRTRLDSGDFRPGDRIVLVVDGEKELSDTFTVGLGTVLVLPQIGEVSLNGVLRSELHTRLADEFARYMRDPGVHVRSLVRLSVEGEVTRPGFYPLPPEMPLADAITAAGGLSRDANLRKFRVERGGVAVLSGPMLQDALRAGTSLDALNLRAGDRVFVPRRGDFERTARILGTLVTIPLAVYTLTRIY